MGFTIYYRSTEPVDPARAAAIRAAAVGVNEGRTWLSCEPVCFLGNDEGRLVGGSKPNFNPHPLDVASAATEQLPDGTVHDLIQALCDISRAHQVDWEFSHDYDLGPIGFIRQGVADDALLMQINALGEVGDALSEIGGEIDSEIQGYRLADESQFSADDSSDFPDDEPPPPLRIWTE